MPRLIDVEALSARMYHDAFETDSDMQKWDSGCWIRYKMFENAIADAPTVEAEPTEEQVKEYCRKRCLVIVTNELFNEMKARWSAEPVRHGHWINHFDDLFPEDSSVECSVCHEYEGIMANDNYCPNCGAKMDEVEDD